MCLGPFECLPCDGMVLKAVGDTHELDCLQGACNQPESYPFSGMESILAIMKL